MKTLVACCVLFLCATGCSGEPEVNAVKKFPVQKTDAEWKAELTPEQYRILRKAGTERPFTGEYTDLDEAGMYRCAGCGAALFSSENKYHSGCGWPAFDKALVGGKIIERVDTSHGMVRTEVLCGNCGGHLGHLFNDGPRETTGMRYCINSAALQFKKEEE
jgi:peptide-methionine (R)-S-oxide reductase